MRDRLMSDAVVYAIAGMFVSRFYTEGMWLFIVFPVCLDRAVENEIRVEARQEESIRRILPDLVAQGHVLTPA